MTICAICSGEPDESNSWFNPTVKFFCGIGRATIGMAVIIQFIQIGEMINDCAHVRPKYVNNVLKFVPRSQKEQEFMHRLFISL